MISAAAIVLALGAAILVIVVIDIRVHLPEE